MPIHTDIHLRPDDEISGHFFGDDDTPTIFLGDHTALFVKDAAKLRELEETIRELRQRRREEDLVEAAEARGYTAEAAGGHA